jgi:hypothetical protein
LKNIFKIEGIDGADILGEGRGLAFFIVGRHRFVLKAIKIFLKYF